MKIIAQKEGIFNQNSFFKTVNDAEYVHGIFLEVTITLDQQIVVFSPINDNKQVINAIQNQPLEHIKRETVVSLEQFLNSISDYKEKIFLKIVSIDPLILTDKDALQVSNYYDNYTTEALKIIQKYPELNIHLCSVNHGILYHLGQKEQQRKMGMIFEQENLNFVDVDFYVFDMNSVNNVLIEELIKKNREVIIDLKDSNNIETLYKHIEKSKQKDLLLENLYVLACKPCVVHDYITEKEKN